MCHPEKSGEHVRFIATNSLRKLLQMVDLNVSRAIFIFTKYSDIIFSLVSEEDNTPDIEEFLDNEIPSANASNANKKLKVDDAFANEDVKPLEIQCVQVQRDNPATCSCRHEDPATKLGRVVVAHELDSGVEECKVFIPSVEGRSTQVIVKRVLNCVGCEIR